MNVIIIFGLAWTISLQHKVKLSSAAASSFFFSDALLMFLMDAHLFSSLSLSLPINLSLLIPPSLTPSHPLLLALSLSAHRTCCVSNKFDADVPIICNSQCCVVAIVAAAVAADVVVAAVAKQLPMLTATLTPMPAP